MKKLLTLALMTALAFSVFADMSAARKSAIIPAAKKVNPDNIQSGSAKGPYTGLMSSEFDRAGHGNGWIYGYNRKVQWNQKLADNTDMPMVGSLYRQLNLALYGTIGGMIGDYSASPLSKKTETLYATSQFWGAKPGGRYPNANEFINGYFFGCFNDFDTVTDTNSWGMFTVADATWGYDWSSWTVPKRTEATEGGASVPGAWTETGDVVYDPATEYYYWTQSWGEGGLSGGIDGAINSVVVGRTLTPADRDSWVWSDYKDLRFDGSDDTAGITAINEFHVAYCKDTFGNGTGYGIAMAVCNDVEDSIMVNDSTVVVQNPKLSWMYTTNWGGDDSSGDWKPNWRTPGPDKLYRLEMKDVFDWYGENLTSRDSIGWDEVNNVIIWDTTEVVILNDPFITWNISNVATENNNVHVLFKAYPGNAEGMYLVTDAGFRAGYYALKGTITSGGVVWNGKARFVGSIVDADQGWDVIENVASNRNNLCMGYAGDDFQGREVVYAAWLDKPLSRAQANPYGQESIWLDDAFFTSSTDGGMNWDKFSVVEFETGDENYPIWTQTYTYNITKTSAVHEMGFCLANHGKVDPVTCAIETYGAHEQADRNYPTEPVTDLNDFQQTLHVWKITGSPNGIEAEQTTLAKDFVLYQNYPNPFNPTTEIKFNLQKDSQVKLSVYNTKGELVSNLKNEKMAKGSHSVNFDAESLNSGVYFYKLNVNGMTETKKMVLTK